MATWAVGDVQGCKAPLKRLLKKVGFSWKKDVLWSTGDIINRGPTCLKTLRWFYKHRDRVCMVLGNHDLHLLAVADGVRKPGRSDTLGEILAAPDRDTLLDWLRRQPLMHREHGHVLVHAGIPPHWSLFEAAARAREVEAMLQSEQRHTFFRKMYGNEPAGWSEDLTGMARLRVITNYFTRMRYCYPDGSLDLLNKGPLSESGSPVSGDSQLKAWFLHPRRQESEDTILFGHWAALQGITNTPGVVALDTGCVWGNALSLYCLDTGERVTEPCGGS